MFCVKCGKELKKGTKFCTNCGTEIKEIKEKKTDDDKLTYSQNKSIETTSNPTPVANATPVNANPNSDGKATASLVLGIVSFVVPCVGFITSIIGLILGIISHEKSGKRTAGIILNSIALGLIILGWILLYSLGYLAAWSESYTPSTPSTPRYNYTTNNNKKNNTTKKVNIDETFTFGDFEISIGNNYSIVQVENEYSQYNGKDVIKLPVTLKNTSDRSTHLNMFYHTYYGPSGKSLAKVAVLFSDDSLDYASDLEPGESYTKYMYILYDGDGKYRIEFNNYKEKKTVEFTINKDA